MDPLQILRDVFPVTAGHGSLELAEYGDGPTEPDKLTVRLVVWDVEGETRTIRDIKEQEVWAGGLEEVDPTRLALAVEGWRMAVEQLFAQDDHDWLAVLMPSDLLVGFADLTELKRPRTADDFAEALLASKHRLGRWLRA